MSNIGHQGQIITTSFEPSWYWYFESLFWPEQIMRIREICERREEEEALTSGATKPEDAQHIMRKNKVTWNNNEELYSMLRGPMNEVNQQSGWNYNITAIEPVQYTIYYGDENHYHWHTDTIVGDDLQDRGENNITNGTIRKISCSIQLTDPREYEGGEFELLNALLDRPDLIKKIKYFQIQFHDFVPDALKMRAEIQRRLSETHKVMWNFPFIWESWERIQ